MDREDWDRIWKRAIGNRQLRRPHPAHSHAAMIGQVMDVLGYNLPSGWEGRTMRVVKRAEYRSGFDLCVVGPGFADVLLLMGLPDAAASWGSFLVDDLLSEEKV